MNTCIICKKKFNNINGLSKHLSMLHNIKLIDYFVKYRNFKIPKCPYCNKDSKQSYGLIFNTTCGGNDCLSQYRKNTVVSDNIRLRISKSMKVCHEKNNHIGWSFINSDENRRSYPEKFFIKLLESNNLYNEYTIKEKLSFGKYFLDFAFLEIKTDVEIDGQQHFRNKKSIEHDEIRDKFLLDNGWKVYRIAWIELRNNPKVIIDEFKKWLKKNNDLYHKYNVNEVLLLVKKRKPIYGNSDDYFKARKNELIIKNKPKIDLILKSDIDFSKFGWVKKVSKLLNIHHGKVNKWMKKYMKDFYYSNCFIRKKNTPP